MSTPEGAIAVKYTGPVNLSDSVINGKINGNYIDEYATHETKYHNKVGENSSHNFYSDKSEHSEYEAFGQILLNLSEDNINGYNEDLIHIKSAIQEIHDNPNNMKYIIEGDNSHVLLPDYIKGNFSENLNQSAFDGKNAYIIFYEDGEIYKTKKLDNFFFNCMKIGENSYKIEFKSDVEFDRLTNSTADLCLILNSTNGLYELKVPIYSPPNRDHI